MHPLVHQHYLNLRSVRYCRQAQICPSNNSNLFFQEKKKEVKATTINHIAHSLIFL